MSVHLEEDADIINSSNKKIILQDGEDVILNNKLMKHLHIEGGGGFAAKNLLGTLTLAHLAQEGATGE